MPFKRQTRPFCTLTCWTLALIALSMVDTLVRTFGLIARTIAQMLAIVHRTRAPITLQMIVGRTEAQPRSNCIQAFKRAQSTRRCIIIIVIAECHTLVDVTARFLIIGQLETWWE